MYKYTPSLLLASTFYSTNLCTIPQLRRETRRVSKSKGGVYSFGRRLTLMDRFRLFAKSDLLELVRYFNQVVQLPLEDLRIVDIKTPISSLPLIFLFLLFPELTSDCPKYLKSTTLIGSTGSALIKVTRSLAFLNSRRST